MANHFPVIIWVVVSNFSPIIYMEEKEDENNRSIIMGIIDQLRKGTDLHRVSLPTFVLEPRSMCERLLDFFSFQYLLQK